MGYRKCTNRFCQNIAKILDRFGRWWCEDCYELYVETDGD